MLKLSLKTTTSFKKKKIQAKLKERLLQQVKHGIRRKYFARVNWLALLNQNH